MKKEIVIESDQIKNFSPVSCNENFVFSFHFEFYLKDKKLVNEKLKKTIDFISDGFLKVPKIEKVKTSNKLKDSFLDMNYIEFIFTFKSGVSYEYFKRLKKKIYGDAA